METGDRILEGARELFFSYGIRSVSMDDIARHLGMSKKTVYQNFKDKDEIVNTLLATSLKINDERLKQLEKDSKDAVQEIILIMKHISEMFSRINPNLFYDMQKYYPEAWKRFQEFKQQSMIKMVETNLKQGIQEKYFRNDIDVKILAKMRIEQVEMAMNPMTFPPDKFNIMEVQLTMIDHFLHGITTLKGHKLLNKYKNINEDE
ncbi:MAG: TetR/AcrR family transcriptional regulator [Bacteroidia bacterium]|nr:TetR/AcrR family transcriptional regulator [Bacteroidia bacterium]